MRVGVYVDGFNLYYGARSWCGRSTPGWRWLDIRSLAASLIQHDAWSGATIDRVVYCTARIDGASNPSGQIDQDAYFKALLASGSVDHIEYGYFIHRVRHAPLAIKDSRGRPILVRTGWPVVVEDPNGGLVEDAIVLVSYAAREEKASDVNVASHLIVDMFEGRIDAAIVISNDSDLRFPVRLARSRIPVGMVNPSPHRLAGALSGRPTDGVGAHWWRSVQTADYYNCQLPDRVGGYRKPKGW